MDDLDILAAILCMQAFCAGYCIGFYRGRFPTADKGNDRGK